MLGVLTGKGHSVASCSTVAVVTGTGVDSCHGSNVVAVAHFWTLCQLLVTVSAL